MNVVHSSIRHKPREEYAMSTLQLIINALLTLLLPILTGMAIGLAVLFERTRAQRLPDHQAPRLEQFARMAVQDAVYRHADSPNKEELAVSSTELLFSEKEWDIPTPSKTAITIAVGSAFYEVSQKGQ